MDIGNQRVEFPAVDPGRLSDEHDHRRTRGKNPHGDHGEAYCIVKEHSRMLPEGAGQLEGHDHER